MYILGREYVANGSDDIEEMPKTKAALNTLYEKLERMEANEQ